MTKIAEITTRSIEDIIEVGELFKIVVTGYSMLPLLGQ